jgi:hypothetical protein
MSDCRVDQEQRVQSHPFNSPVMHTGSSWRPLIQLAVHAPFFLYDS